jgi:hypothetical protein
MEEFLRCIPTVAVMSVIDHEQGLARERLATFLDEGSQVPDDDARIGAGDRELTYLCSFPHRRDNGVIGYVHLFQDSNHVTTKASYFHVAASPDWWPKSCRSLPPQRSTSGRALLRLVS